MELIDVKEMEVGIDKIICPVCQSEAIKTKIENSYTCYHCGATIPEKEKK